MFDSETGVGKISKLRIQCEQSPSAQTQVKLEDSIFPYFLLPFLAFLLFVFLSFFKIVVQVQLSLFSYHHFPPSQCYPPLALSFSLLYMFLDDSSPSFPCHPPLQPLWLLSVCSLFQCLWLYFACLFVLLIRFHL